MKFFSGTMIVWGVLSAISIAQAHAPFTAETLSQEMNASFDRVEDFRWIREEAKRLGLRVYLPGTSATNYAFYVKHYLEWKSGSTEYYPEQFDYDYTNIFRPNDHFQLLVDGDAEKAQLLKIQIEKRYSAMLASDGELDMKVLPKHPPTSFVDSNQAALVELTAPTKGGVVAGDLNHHANSSWLQEALDGQLHFTSKLPENDPLAIVEVMKYLDDVFRNEQTIPAEDFLKIKKIADAFDPHGEVTKSVSFQRNFLRGEGAIRLMRDSPNVEYLLMECA